MSHTNEIPKFHRRDQRSRKLSLVLVSSESPSPVSESPSPVSASSSPKESSRSKSKSPVPKSVTKPCVRVRRNAPVRHGGRIIRVDNEKGRLLLSNIGALVSAQQILDKFKMFGNIGKVILHLDEKMQLIGTAEVWMALRRDAEKAKDKLNGNILFDDGRPIRVEKGSFIKEPRFWSMVMSIAGKASSTAKATAKGFIKSIL